MAPKKTAEPSYAEALKELQAIATAFDDEKVGIDDLSKKVKRAAELIRFCKEKLRSVEEELDEMQEE